MAVVTDLVSINCLMSRYPFYIRLPSFRAAGFSSLKKKLSCTPNVIKGHLVARSEHFVPLPVYAVK